jgi:hypothetical protein
VKNLELNGYDDTLGDKHDFNKGLIVQFGGESHQQQNRAGIIPCIRGKNVDLKMNTRKGVK